MTLRISSAFETGSILVDSARDPSDIRLRLKPDGDTGFVKWFHFRLAGARGRDCVMTITNASDVHLRRLGGRGDMDDCWTGYRAVASYDLETWFRVDTSYDGRELTIRHRPERDAIHFAQFAPYSNERHAALVARTAVRPGVRLSVLGRTVEGRDLDLLTIGDPGNGRASCWFLARQHPNETQGSWFMEGFLDRLTDPDDALARQLRRKAVFRIVPNMNPDGVARGQTRMNAAMANLNREWLEPSMERSPEVALVRAAMGEAGVDFLFDAHADADLTFVFLGGAQPFPGLTARQTALFERFEAAFAAANPDYRTGKPYPGGLPERGDPSMGWNRIAEEFGCLTVLLEMVFKDAEDMPDPIHGFSPARCRQLGRTALDGLAAVIDDLR